MKRYMILMVFICWLMYVFGPGYAGLFAQDAENGLISAKSIEQLPSLIERALEEKDTQRLEEIKIHNLELVRGNLFLTVQKCNTILDEGIKYELAGEREKGEINFMIARIMAEIYQRAYNNSFLLDKVDLFSRWEIEQREKYLEAEKFFAQGEIEKKKYNYETAVPAYHRGLALYREINYKAGEAKTQLVLGEVRRMLSEFEQALDSYVKSLAIFREIKDKVGEANCLKCLGDIYQILSENGKAREMILEGLITFREIQDRLGEANTLQSLGDVHYQLDEYEKAQAMYEQCLALFREIKNQQGEATVFVRLGDVYRLLNEYEKARERYEQGLVIFREIKDILGEATTLYSLGNVYYQLAEYEIAREKYEKGLAIYREKNVKLGEANCLLRLGEVHRTLDEYEKALQLYERCLVIYRERRVKLGEANALQGLGVVFRLLSEYEKAREIYEQGLFIYRAIHDRFGEAYTLQSLGDVNFELAEYEKAREQYEQSLAIFREIKDRLGEANVLQSLGDLHLLLSRYEKAREKYEQSLAIFREIKVMLGEANSLQSLGDVLVSLSEYEQARQSYEQGLVIFREIKARLGEANTLQSLGHEYLLLSDYEKARQSYEQGLVIFREIKARLGEASTLRSLGDVHRILNEYKKSRRYYKKALSIQKKIGERYGMARSYYELGQTFEAMNNPSAAEKEYINSINTTEAVWEEMKREEFKSSFLSSKISPYENLIRLLVKQDKGPLAFHYAERSKARSFLYLLGNKRIDIKKGVPLALVRQEEELRQKIVGLTGQMIDNEKKEPGRRSSPALFNNEMLQLKQTHGEILEKMKLQCPEYANMISVNPLSLEEIQTLIRQTGNTVFLEYYTTPDAAYLWVLDGKDIFPYKIDIKSETLAKKVREYYTMIATPDAFGVATLEFQARELYNLLLKPAETHLAGKTRIGVIPHGVLHYLPFEALMNNGKFLAEQDMRFFYLPSASAYKYCRNKNPLKKEQLIALGNPDGTLVWAEKEVEGLKSLYNLGPRIYIGKDATETQARTDGPSADILHFSCHGVFDSDHPMYSNLKLAPDSKEDGNLDVQEIFQLELKPAYLVTLSACQTHVGKINSGDEIVMMSRAFIYAGTPSIVASLWNVAPDYTEKLMVSFYRALKNTDKIEALHCARKEMMETYGKKHPFYWAPFVLIGDFR